MFLIITSFILDFRLYLEYENMFDELDGFMFDSRVEFKISER